MTSPAEEPSVSPGDVLAGKYFVTRVIGRGAGGIFAGLTAGKKASADERCPDKLCDASGLGDVSTARTYAWVANITFGAGGALVLVGGILALTAKPTSAPVSATALHVVPVVGNRSGGVVVGGAF